MNDASANGGECVLLIPRLPDFAWADWEAAHVLMREGLRLELGQPWLAEREADFQPGWIWLGLQGEDLVVYAELRDEAPSNRAALWDDPTWMTGDVLELFFQAEGRPGYFEFHVTPENKRLQLFFPSSAAFNERRGHRHWAIAESKFESCARVNAKGDGWQVLMRMPLAMVLDLPREDGSRRFRFLFSRYDYQPGRDKPVRSSIGQLSQPDFHHIPEWLWAMAAE